MVTQTDIITPEDVEALVAHRTTLPQPGDVMRRKETKPEAALTAQGAGTPSSQSHMVLLRVTEIHRAGWGILSWYFNPATNININLLHFLYSTTAILWI